MRCCRFAVESCGSTHTLRMSVARRVPVMLPLTFLEFGSKGVALYRAASWNGGHETARRVERSRELVAIAHGGEEEDTTSARRSTPDASSTPALKRHFSSLFATTTQPPPPFT